ncbi:MAG: ATP-dependent helicase [Candidatus Melainabacteria bacterium]|nr:MAG: ATP-dependent helicase [Candidatus Melainabacteria bacterium]
MNNGQSVNDRNAEHEIIECMNPLQPRNFFLYAGAGAGKTRALKNVLDEFRKVNGDEFRRSGRKVAVITYTNAAANEISTRLGNDLLFPVSTIHSFCWAQIGKFHADIQSWLIQNLPLEILELEDKQAKGRANSQASIDRARAIKLMNERLQWLSVSRRFTYSPTGENYGMASLTHSEVIKLTADFICSKKILQTIITNRFPFLLIDECQDTNRLLMKSLFELALEKKGKFALGLFGDTMQRIYSDGYSNLMHVVPGDWATPQKLINYRSSKRIVELGNSLRADIDTLRQEAHAENPDGIARLFVSPAATSNKVENEQTIMSKMAELTGDENWLLRTEVKTLTLEHHMAAHRNGFSLMFEALDDKSSLGSGLRKGDLAGLKFFSEKVQPLLEASAKGDTFGVMSHLRKCSPLLKKLYLEQFSESMDPLSHVRDAVRSLTELEGSKSTVTFFDVLQSVGKSGLFELPRSLRSFVDSDVGDGENAERMEGNEEPDEPEQLQNENDAESSSSKLRRWRAFLETPYRQIVPYSEYVAERGPYGTHQGVKGLEFERVMVILDDSAARGYSFSFEKLLGAKPSKIAKQKQNSSDESGIDSTRRLLYVTCTRAKRSLALVAYTENPDSLISAVQEHGWLKASEIERV